MFQVLRKSSNSFLGGIILIAALVCCLIFATAFLHVHIGPYGNLISHSHPFAKSARNPENLPNHSHTNFEFLHFYLLSFLDELILIAVLLFIIILLRQRIKKSADFLIPLAKIFSFYSNRAPPSIYTLPI